MNKKTVLLGLSFVAVFALGMLIMYFIARSGASAALEEAEPMPLAPAGASVQVVDMKGASAAEGVVEVKEPEYVDSAAISSQLSKIKVEGMTGIVLRMTDPSEEERPVKTTSVTLPDGASVVSTGVQPAPAAAGEESKITMINAPVKARVIKSTADYKKFKQSARGEYPQVDFNKQMVVVLESDSNLPDKVFEIEDVQTKDGQLVVLYRVNIFGLDKKINTHSAKSVAKQNLPVKLKQVL